MCGKAYGYYRGKNIMRNLRQGYVFAPFYQGLILNDGYLTKCQTGTTSYDLRLCDDTVATRLCHSHITWMYRVYALNLYEHAFTYSQRPGYSVYNGGASRTRQFSDRTCIRYEAWCHMYTAFGDYVESIL